MQLNVVHNVGVTSDEKLTAIQARERFAAALQQARVRYGHESGQGEISRRAFALALGITGERPEERYRLYETAEREPPMWVLASLRRVTGFSLDAMIAGLPQGRNLTEQSGQNRGDRPPVSACVVRIERTKQSKRRKA